MWALEFTSVLKSWLFHWLAGQPWASYTAFLNFTFHICKTEMIGVPTSNRDCQTPTGHKRMEGISYTKTRRLVGAQDMWPLLCIFLLLAPSPPIRATISATTVVKVTIPHISKIGFSKVNQLHNKSSGTNPFSSDRVPPSPPEELHPASLPFAPPHPSGLGLAIFSFLASLTLSYLPPSHSPLSCPHHRTARIT